MRATEARKNAINSVQKEIDEIELKINKAGEAGEMCISLHNLTSAAKAYFVDNDFRVHQEVLVNHTLYIISW
jgi:hypothetical protein